MRQRILHVTTGLELGGAESLLVEAAAQAVARGDETRIVALKSGGANRARLERRGIPVVELGLGPRIPDPRALARLSQLAGEFRPTIVQAWMYHANLFALAALRLGHPALVGRLVWGIYNTQLQLDRYSRRLRAVIRLGALCSRLPAAIVYNAERAERDHAAIGFRPRRCAVIRNGVDLDRFRPDAAARARTRSSLGIADDAVVGLVAARRDPQKDWPTTLAAARLAGAVTMLAVGQGTETLPDQPGLRRLGPRDDMAAVYAAADMFVLLSGFGEGTSVAMSEAMASGLPVIVTDVGDNARYAERAGFVVRSGDPAAVAERMAALAADPAGRRRLGAAARATALAEFDAARSFAALDELYERIAAGR